MTEEKSIIKFVGPSKFILRGKRNGKQNVN